MLIHDIGLLRINGRLISKPRVTPCRASKINSYTHIETQTRKIFLLKSFIKDKINMS